MSTTEAVEETAATVPREGQIAAAEAALEAGDAERAASALGPYAAEQAPLPDDLDTLRRVMRAALETGFDELAARSIEAARRAGSGDALRLLDCELHLAHDDIDAARGALEGASPDNVVAPALAKVLARFDPARPAATHEPLDLESHVLWFEPVATALLYFLEREVERRLELEPRNAALHAARTTLFRPDLSPELFRAPRAGFFDRWRSADALERRKRERAVVQRVRAKDIDAAIELLRTWLEERPNEFEKSGPTLSDPRRALLVELLFATDRFAELIALCDAEGEDAIAERFPAALALVAYAELITGDAARALRLTMRLDSTVVPSAATAHLAALASLRGEEGPARVVPWLRRAFRRDDIGTVALVRAELALLDAGAHSHAGDAPPSAPPAS